MADAVIVSGPAGALSLVRRGAVELVRAAALAHEAAACRRLVNPMLQQHEPADVRVKVTTDGNDAASATNVALNLSDLGLTVASGALRADEERDLFVSAVVSAGANRYRFRTRQRVGVSGGELVLKGRTEFLTDCLATYGMTTSNGAATTEAAAECRGPAWWDGAAPVAGDISSNAMTIQWLGANSPVGALIPGAVEHMDDAAAAADARSLQHGGVSLSNGTSSIFISDVATPTAATFSNASAVRASAIILPPVSLTWLIDTASTPDELLLCPVGISAINLTWDISVMVGDPIYLPFTETS